MHTLIGRPSTAPLPLTPSERFDRALALMAGGNQLDAVMELAALEAGAPELKPGRQLQRGNALHQL